MSSVSRTPLTPKHISPPAVWPPLSHMPAAFPVWCLGISSACWNRGSSSDLRRSRGRDPRQSPGEPSWADAPSPWLDQLGQ